MGICVHIISVEKSQARKSQMKISSKKPLFILHSYSVIDTATSQLTKTAITVTAIFIVALGYDLWYYL